MFGPTYSIANWDEQFENASSRKLKVLGWVPIPNGHDSTAYCRLMNRKDGPEIFTAWILLVQLASRCHDRGVLASNDGRPYQASEIALKTRAPEKLFIKGLPELVAMGWVEAEGESGESANASGESANASGGGGRIAAGNRTEEKEQKRIELPTQKWRDIYNLYPRKVSPVAAEKAIRKALTIKTPEYLREAVVAYSKAVKAVDKKFIPYPASWFNAGCYDDDRSEWGTNSDNYQKPGDNSADSIIKELQKQTDRL